jgi:lipopolysaccharide transport system ATP-binding protein
MAAISVRQLGKQYRLGLRQHNTLRDQISSWFTAGQREEAQTFWALRDVSIEVNEGEVLGVIGRNGAGKSTLLKILSQITDPSEGEVRIHGRVASLLEVGTGFHPELSGRENVFLNGAILGMSRREIRAKFDAIVAFAEVEKFIDTAVKHYSSGMYVRLAFAVAAHLEPEILIVDEVLAVGDAAFQKRCLGKMGEVAQGGRTVLFVSHNLPAVSALCSRVLLLAEGRVQSDGPADTVIAQYLAATKPEVQEGFRPRERAGNGRARITDLRVGSATGEPHPACGSGLQICVSYAAEEEKLPLQFLVGIYDASGQRTLFLDSRVDPDLPEIFPREGVLKLSFGREFSLLPGRYSVNAALRLHGELADHVPDALAFEMEDGDFFGTGRKPAGSGAVFYKNQWHLTS